MNATAELLTQTRRIGCVLSIKGDKLRVEPADRLTPALCDALRSEKPRIMRLLKLEAAYSKACLGLDNVKPADVLAGLCAEDLAELEACPDPLPFLRSFAFALSVTKWRKDGIAPPWWTSPAHCDQCGPVFLWAPVKVAGCPWCWNRLHGLRIPRP